MGTVRIGNGHVSGMLAGISPTCPSGYYFHQSLEEEACPWFKSAHAPALPPCRTSLPNRRLTLCAHRVKIAKRDHDIKRRSAFSGIKGDIERLALDGRRRQNLDVMIRTCVVWSGGADEIGGWSGVWDGKEEEKERKPEGGEVGPEREQWGMGP